MYGQDDTIGNDPDTAQLARAAAEKKPEAGRVLYDIILYTIV